MENVPSLPGRYESPLLPISSSATAYTVIHGRGTPPRHVTWVLVCLIANNGYTPGRRMDANPGYGFLIAASWDAAQITFSGNSAITNGAWATLAGGGNFSPLATQWALQCIADF